MNGHIKNDVDWYLASLCMRCEPVGRRPTDGEELFWTDYGPLMAETARKQCLTRAEAIKRGATQQPPPPTQKNETASRKRAGVQKTT